jgi:glycogen debranching enzyme
MKFIIKIALSFTILLLIPKFASGQTNYENRPLPTFKDSKLKLPIPVIENEPGWLDLYWFCWEEAFTKLKKPEPNSPFISAFVDEAFAPQIFQWDTHFMLMFWKYAYHIFPAIRSHDNFYVCQDDDGYICREIHESDGSNLYWRGKDNTINPPLFAWVEYEYYRISGDDSRFEQVIPVLEDYMNWIEKNRDYQGGHNLYWQTNLGSGMDNSPRAGTGWVAMSAQVFMSYKYMARMAERIGKENKADTFLQKALAIEKEMNNLMWNKKDGLYYDIYDTGEQIPVKTVACFWPMLANIASDKRAARMKNVLQDTSKFWRLVPFPTLAADHPAYIPDGYWLGAVWAPTNYMILKGLENYGYHDLAYQASKKYLKGMHEVFQKTGTVWENYNPDKYVRNERAKPDFVGWTGLGPISVLIESVIGIKINAPANTVEWHIHRTDRHGVKNLAFDHQKVSLLAEERSSPEETARINIETNKSFQLIIHIQDRMKEFDIEQGSSVITF